MTSELRANVVVTGARAGAREIDHLGSSADRTGGKLEAMGHDAGFLSKQIAEAETQYKDLIREFDKTGNVDLLRSIRKERRQMRLFQGLKKELEQELEEAARDLATPGGGGTTVGRALAQSIGSALAAGGPYLIGGVVALAAAVLPFLGAAVAGTVLGAVGAGGVIGGFALAVSDPRIRAEFGKLGATAKAAFKELGDDFAAPAMESLHILEAGVRDVADELDRYLKPISDLMPTVTRGLVGFIENTVTGLGEGLQKAEPAIRALSNELPKIGDSIGDFFKIIGEESDGAVLGFEALSKVLRATIRGAGMFLAQLSAIYEWSVKVNAKFTGLFEDVVGWVPLLGSQVAEANDEAEAMLAGLQKAKDGSHDFSGSLKEMGSIAKNTTEQLDEMKNALDALFGDIMDAREATRAYEQAIDDLAEAVAENGRTLDVRTKQGRAVQAALDAEAKAIKGIRDANIDNNMSVEDANAIYYKQLEALRKQAYQLGLNKQQVDAFIDSLKAIPAKAEVEVYAPGLLEAIARAKELARLLGSNAAAANAARGGTYVSGRAGGGPVVPGQTYVVGENGPEVLKMGANGGYVYSSGSGPSTSAVMSGASGGAAQQWRFTWEPPASGSGALSAVAAALMPYLIKGFRVNGVPLSSLGAGS